MITRNYPSRTLIIHPTGLLDALQADHLRRQLRALIDEGYRYLIFDLAEINHITSSGLGLLVEFYNTVVRLEGSLKLINCCPQASWLLGQTRLDKILMGNDAAPSENPPINVHFDALHAAMSDEILLLAQIHAITEQILGQDTPEEIGKSILQGAIKALKAERGALLLLNEPQSHLRLIHWQGKDKLEACPRLAEMPLPPGSLEHKLLHADRVTWHRPEELAASQGHLFSLLKFQAALTAPIRGRERNYGLIIIEPGEETGLLLGIAKPLIHTFTNICGLALERVLLNVQSQKQAAEIQEILQRSDEYHQTLLDAGRLASLGVVIGSLSHLINNKMVPLVGYTQMLAQKKGLSDWVTDKVIKIQQSGNEVSQIVEKMLKISRLHGRSRKPVDVADLLRTAQDLLCGNFERENIAVHVHVAPDSPTLVGDPDFMLQALLAVLHRACTSFAQSGGERWIRLVTAVNGNNLRLVVEDNGGNFDEFDLGHWIDPIVPSEAMIDGRIFNYNIPRTIVQRHKGSLVLEPRSEGGKRVVIDLPIEPLPKAVA